MDLTNVKKLTDSHVREALTIAKIYDFYAKVEIEPEGYVLIVTVAEGVLNSCHNAFANLGIHVRKGSDTILIVRNA